MEKNHNKNSSPALVAENWKFSDERIKEAWNKKSAQYAEFKEIFNKEFNG